VRRAAEPAAESLIAPTDWICTGRRYDHPGHLFCTWAVPARLAAEQAAPVPTPPPTTR
jgi:hypothetical protein